MKIYFIVVIFFVVLFSTSCDNTGGDNFRLLSAAKDADIEESGWEKEYWSNQENYSDTLSESYGTRILKLDSDTLTVARWFKKINVKPYADYKVSGYIKTENVEGENLNSGAGFRLGRIEFSGDTIFKGDSDWTYVEMEFNSRGEDSFMLECLLGKEGRAKGKVMFDNLKLQEISVKTLKPSIVIHLNEKKEPMSSYLYGQFIEHMGKSFYGGMWAEMLNDRKFYYVPGTGKSPWRSNIDTTLVSVDSTKSFSSGKLPVFKNVENLVLNQDDLSVKQGERYVGRIVFKATAGINQLQLTLSSLEGSLAEKTFDVDASGYQKIPFEFTSDGTSENANLQVHFRGKGDLTLAAVSLMPSDNIQGFRPDVIALMKELNSPIYRWPGGNFVSGYDWKDGIGDPDQRPTRFERAWNGLEYNDVGIHEFMELCSILNAEANIAVNTGLGTAEMAAEEVEYVNGDTNSKMGKWRQENGHPEPYNVKLWAVGNEMFGDWQLGHMPIEDYVVKHNKVAKAMWDVDPDLDLIAVGYPGEWNNMMYENSAGYMTFISEHFYRQDWHAGGLLTHVKQIPDAIREIAEEHRRCRGEIPELEGKEIKIALDEWNYWYGPHDYGLLGTRYFLRDALGIAAGFNELSRQSDIYYMANYAQTVNVIGAIKTTKNDSWLEGTGLVLKLYRQEFGTQPIVISGASEPLDVAATITDDGQFLTISVVNATHQDYSLSMDGILGDIMPEGNSFIITGENDMVYNDEENKDKIYIAESEIEIEGKKIKIPKESAGIYKFSINN